MSDILGGGTPIDIRTMRPKEPGPSLQEQFEEKRFENDVAIGLEALTKLKSKGGKLFVSTIEEELQRRIDELVSKDAEAQAFLRLLEKFGNLVRAGEFAAKRLTEMRVGRQGKGTLNTLT